MKTDELILDRATALIERNGVTALSIRNLANEVHLTPMALYRHYVNRGALLQAVTDRYFVDMADRWQSLAAKNQYEQTLILIGLDLIDFYLEHPHIYQLMFIEPRTGARNLSEKAGSSESPTFSIVIATVKQGIAIGELCDIKALEIALALAGQLHGLVALRHGGRLDMPNAEFRTFCQSAFIRAINAYKVHTT
jgi:AcrR family transcriptional regulator